MPSPFPGMDPFIEDQEWQDFHTRFNTALSDELAPSVDPKYVVRIERRIYVEHDLGDDDQVRWADAAILRFPGESAVAVASLAQAGVALMPVECVLPMPQERRETYLVIRELPTMEVVTVIETLSPTNKRSSGDGREQYLTKREEILSSRTNLVEIDLLRGGKRLPAEGRPAGDYFAFVSRGHRRPRTDVYHWNLRDRLPPIPIPLKKGDPEASVDLQLVFNTVFDRARYQLSLDYTQSLSVPFDNADMLWVRELPLTSTKPGG